MIRLKLAGLEQCLLKSDLLRDGKIIALQEEIISSCVLRPCERSAAQHLLPRGDGKMTKR